MWEKSHRRMNKMCAFRESMVVPTGLVGKKANEVLESVIGQMSDGMWENTRGYEKYWAHCEIDMSNNIIVDKGWASGFKDMDEDKVRAFFCRKINAILMEWFNWHSNDDVENCSYLSYEEKISVDEIKQMVKQIRRYGKTPVKAVTEVASAKVVRKCSLDAWI